MKACLVSGKRRAIRNRPGSAGSELFCGPIQGASRGKTESAELSAPLGGGFLLCLAEIHPPPGKSHPELPCCSTGGWGVGAPQYGRERLSTENQQLSAVYSGVDMVIRISLLGLGKVLGIL